MMNTGFVFLGLMLLLKTQTNASIDLSESEKDVHQSYMRYHVSAFYQDRFMEIISDTYDREYGLVNQLISSITAAQNSHFEDKKIIFFEQDFQYKLTLLDDMVSQTVWAGIPLFQSPDPSLYSPGRTFHFTFYGIEDEVVIHLPSLDLVSLKLDKATVLTQQGSVETLKILDEINACLDKCKRAESKALDDFYDLGEKKYAYDQALKKETKIQFFKKKILKIFSSKKQLIS